MNSHREIIQLIIAYTLAGALVFTVIMTCLSLVGWIKFKDARQQAKLFYVLIVELCVVAVGFFRGVLQFDPIRVKDNIAARGADQVLADQPATERSGAETGASTSPADSHSTTDRIRRFWKADGTIVNKQNEQIIKEWMRNQGLTNTSITMFLYAEVFEPQRISMIRDLKIK